MRICSTKTKSHPDGWAVIRKRMRDSIADLSKANRNVSILSSRDRAKLRRSFAFRWVRIPRHSNKKCRYPNGYLHFLAEDEGFEPPQTESESGVLPLHKSSMRNSYIICNVPKKSSPFFKFLQILFSVPLRSGNQSIPEYSSPACPDADSSGNRPHLPAS